MDESESLSYTCQDLKSIVHHRKPFSFLHRFDPNHAFANFNCFLGGKIPLKIEIVGFFHQKNCPVEITATACQADITLNIRKEAVMFSHFQSSRSSWDGYNWDSKRRYSSEMARSTPSVNKQIYEIRVEHGHDRWILFKTHGQIFSLYKAAKKFLVSKSKKQMMIRTNSADERGETKLPPLPKRAKDRDCGKHFKTRKKIIGRFFCAVCEQLVTRNLPELLRFLEISHLSFIHEIGCKQKEGPVMMRNMKAANMPFFKKRWLVVKDTCVCYLKDRYRLGGVFLMDKNFKVGTEPNLFRKNCFVISSDIQQYRVRCFSEFDRIQFLFGINLAMQSTGNMFMKPAPNESFAPIRFDVPSQWYTNIYAFFEALGDAIASAQEEIFIAGWFLAPMISLRLNAIQEDWNIDKLLKFKANEGVHVYILLSREFEFVDFVQKTFEETKNIMILSHPAKPFINGGSVHHERLVVVDQSNAFLGGMDSAIYFYDSQPSLMDGDSLSELLDETLQTERLSFSIITADDSCSKKSEVFRRQNSQPMFHGLLENRSSFSSKSSAEARKELNPPMHDVMCSVWGNCARDLARHFIQCWNAANQGLQKKAKLPLLIPKKNEDDDEPRPASGRLFNLARGSDASRKPDFERIERNSSRTAGRFCCSAQVLRSACEWSAGLGSPETSIYSAILSCIEEAEHFIYVESHLFISPIDGDTEEENEIGRALVQKILEMHLQNRPFRVFVVLPLLPLSNATAPSSLTSGQILRNVLYRQQLLLTRRENSFLKQLQEALHDVDVSQFVSFCGLRSFCRDSLSTNQVQVYSKVWIFDDKEVIIGSANVIDRSLSGYMDSEVCIHIKDTELRSSRMNGELYQAGAFAWSLRKNLMAKHLGLDLKKEGKLLCDPVNKYFYKHVWMETAKRNSRVFEMVFNCCPTNSIRTSKDLEKHFRSTPLFYSSPQAAHDLLDKVRGHLVEFPLHFLGEEDLSLSAALTKALPRRISTI